MEDSARSIQQELVEKEDILAESREENAGLVEDLQQDINIALDHLFQS
jgi:hypothetical protein